MGNCLLDPLQRFNWLKGLKLRAVFRGVEKRLSVVLTALLFFSYGLHAAIEVLQVIDEFDSDSWSEEGWVFSHNVVRSRVDDGRSGKALSMAMEFAERVNGYGQVSFKVDPAVAERANGIRFRLKGDGTTTMLTHWLGRDIGNGKHQNYATIRPVGLDTEPGQWRVLDFPLEYFRYPQDEMKDAIHMAFILTQRISDSPADASTVVIDAIEIYHDPQPEEWLIHFEDGEQFIESLNLDHPSLKEVQRAARLKDYGKAAEAYANYMQRRRKPLFYLDYRNTEAILESYASLYGANDFTGIAIDELMQGTLSVGEFVGKFPDGPIDWLGESQGLPWTWSAVNQRMHFLPELGKAYLATGDERYAEKAWHYFNDFNQQWPAGKFDSILPQFIGWHHGIGVGERTYSLVWAYQFFQRCTAFTPERHIAWQSAIFEHAQWLKASIDQGFRYTNQQVTEIFGLVAAAVMFPESCYAEEWMATALETLLLHMEQEVLEDGAYVELVPGYHNWMADIFLKLARLLKVNHVDIPETFMIRAERMYGWTGFAIRPDGMIPAIGDGGAFGLLQRMALGAAAFENPEFKFLSRGVQVHKQWYWFLGPEAIEAAKELEAKEPVNKLYHAEASGFVSTRTDWSPKAHYLFFNAIQDGGVGHGHKDGLAIDLSYNGRNLVADPGMLGYHHPNHLNFFHTTRAHSVLMLDGKDFPNAKPELIAAEARRGYDYFHGRQSLQQGREWERRVWFLQDGLPGATIVYDRAIGEGAAKLELIWRLDKSLSPVLHPEKSRFIIEPTDTLSGMLAMVQSADPELALQLSMHDGLPNFEGKPPAVICGYGAPLLPQAVWTVFLPLAPGESVPDDSLMIINRPDGSVGLKLPRNGSTFDVTVHPNGSISW